MAVAAARRRADGDEHRIGLAHGPRQFGGEGEAPRLDVAGDEVVEAGLEDQDLASRSAAILSAALSTQVTTWPKSAKQAPETRPT